MNSKSNEEESIPLYAEVTSKIIWVQLVTGSRDPFIMAELEERSNARRRSQNTGFFGGTSNYRNDLNEGFDGTGPGIRVRYAQLRNCLDTNSFMGTSNN